MKKAVILFNLGGPDSKNAVRPFLINFFMDKNIIRLPVPWRCIVATLIANRRSKREARESYDEIGGFSPLLVNTNDQARALEKQLKKDNKSDTYKVFTCMRYWHPMSPQVVREVRDWGADEIILLPLYPQYSTTTTRSSLQVWEKACHEADYHKPTRMVCCYPMNTGYINASAENIALEYKRAKSCGDTPRILFSAHGLPKSVIKDGDPYQWQCEQSAAKIAERLHVILSESEGSKSNKPESSATPQNDKGGLDWKVCYQSKVGPQKWIGPSTEECLEEAAKEGKSVLIYPHAFTQEHVETLVELDVEYKEEAEKMGLHGYYRAKTVGTHPTFIAGLGDMVTSAAANPSIAPDSGACLCPEKFGECCMREFATRFEAPPETSQETQKQTKRAA